MTNSSRAASRALLFAALLAGLAGACGMRTAQPDPGAAPERAADRHGSPSYRAASLPERFPEPSEAAPGWEAERLWSRHVDWEPVIAVDPVTPDVYQVTTRYYAPECAGCPDPAVVFRRSSDGGAVWGEDRYLSRRGKWQADPQVAVALDGTIHLAYLQNWKVFVVRSFDRGESWTEPLAVGGEQEPSWADKPILVLSPDGQDVYLAFNASDSYVVASHDSGASFSAAVRTNDDGRYWFHTDGGLAADGAIYFAATDYRQNLRGAANVRILRSTDGGGSWTTQLIDTSAQAPGCRWWADGCYVGFFGPSAALAIDPAGRLVLAYNASSAAGAAQRLWVRTSVDGLVWSPRRRVSRLQQSLQSGFPAVEAGPSSGDFRLVFQDDRRTARPRGDNPKKRWNTWYRRSEDGGLTWSRPVRLSDRGRSEVYKTGRGYAFPFGDYLWLAVDGAGTNHVIWGEGESYDGSGGTWSTRGR